MLTADSVSTTGFTVSTPANRRAVAERAILDAAWSVMAREGVAALSVREVARSVGLRQQSLTYYFPTKQALLDALFADGFADLRAVLEGLPISRESIGGSSRLPRPPSRTAPRTRPAST
jgi:AcrR family transcriptional regulator